MPPTSFRFLSPDSPRRAPDYGSRSMQFKLMMLVGSLFAVIWCMQYAGKPETWNWLVKMDEAAKARKNAANQTESGSEKDPSFDSKANPASPNSTESSANRQTAPIPNSSDPVWPNPWAKPGSPVALPTSLEKEYWRIVLPRLSPDQRFAFVDAAHQWGSDLAPSIPVDPVLQSALLKLSNLRQLFDQQLKSVMALDELSTSNPSPTDPGLGEEQSDQKAEDSLAANQADANNVDPIGTDTTEADSELPSVNPTAATRPLFQLPSSIDAASVQSLTDHSRWLASFWDPLLRANQDAAIANDDETGNSVLLSEAIANRDHWQLIRVSFIEPQLLATVIDGSRLGRAEERAAWLYFVQRTRPRSNSIATSEPGESAPPSPAETVTRQNLMGQPEAFRGQRVQVRGTIRRIELIRQTDPIVAKSMSAPEYAVVWLQPNVSGQGPYCIYCTNDPNLAKLTAGSPDPRRPANVEGWFFKLYPYTAQKGQTAVCPLLITDKLEFAEPTAAAPAASLSTGQWGMVIGGISLLAIGLATAGWYSTRYRSANPLGARKRSATKVEWLDRQTIPSPSENLRNLAAEENRGASA